MDHENFHEFSAKKDVSDFKDAVENAKSKG